jgi:TonB family protein
MKGFLLFLLLIVAGFNALSAPQDSRPPLSKDEVMDLLMSSTPSKVIVSTVNQYGIAFQPTPQVLEQFRKARADSTVLKALREAWHADIPKPLGDREILILLAGEAPSENIARLVQERGIDFQPSADYLNQLRSQGAQDVLLDTLRKSTPRPFSKDELLQQLRAHVDQARMVDKVRERAIDFDPGPANLQALRAAGAGAPLVEAIRTAKHAKPFAPQAAVGMAPSQVSHPLEGRRPATLICEPSDHDVPVFDSSGDLGKIIARLKCGEQITFLERVASPPGFDRIQFADGKEGLVSNTYLEFAIATPGGDVKPPSLIYKPDAKYTPEAARDGIEGTVKIWIVIDTQGNVTDAQENSVPLGHGLDESALATVKKWRFSPATRNGVPVAVRVGVEVAFRMGPKSR